MMLLDRRILLVAVALTAGNARAEAYLFTTLLDDAVAETVPDADGTPADLLLTAQKCPAINSSGTVAMRVRGDDGIIRLVTRALPDDELVVVADTRTNLPDFPTFCDNGLSAIPSDPSINDDGAVAFQGNPRRLTTRLDCGTTAQRARRQGVFRGAGGPLTTIAHTINPPGGDFIAEFLVADQSVNDAGDVAFVPELDVTFEHGLFVGSGDAAFDQRFLVDTSTDGFNFNNLSSRVSMNDLGQIAFESGLNDSDLSGIFLSNPDGTFVIIVDNQGGLATGDPSLNNNGRVAFTANEFDEDFNQIFSIKTSAGGSIKTIAESGRSGYASFQEPSINDFGKVVFTADVQLDPDVFVTFQGVFTGSKPSNSKVLQAGDVVDGVVVTSVTTCAEALNNAGEIVMLVQSEDELFNVRTLVVKATPNEDDQG